MSVNGERIVSDYLRSRQSIIDLQARVVGKTPSDTEDLPWIRVTQLDASSSLNPEHLVPFLLQIDCYSRKPTTTQGGQPEVSSLARKVREELAQIQYETHSGGTVMGAAINNDARIPDTDLEPARERRSITATVWMHP